MIFCIDYLSDWPGANNTYQEWVSSTEVLCWPHATSHIKSLYPQCLAWKYLQVPINSDVNQPLVAVTELSSSAVKDQRRVKKECKNLTSNDWVRYVMICIVYTYKIFLFQSINGEVNIQLQSKEQQQLKIVNALRRQIAIGSNK